MFKAKINKWWIPIALTALFIFPISASDLIMTEVDPIDYQLIRYETVTEGKLVNYIDLNTSYNFHPGYAFGAYVALELLQGHTYEIEIALQTSADVLGEGLYKILIAKSKLPDLFDSTDSTLSYSSNPSLYVIEIIKSGDLQKLKITFNTDTISISPSGIRFMYFITTPLNSSSTIKATFGAVSCKSYIDEDQSVFYQKLYDKIANISDNQDYYYTNALEVLDSIKSQQEQTNQKIDDLPSKIDEVLENDAEREKAEATSSGNDNISAATDALTNAFPVASLKDAISPLLTACSYEGITSVWTFPSIKIPALTGLINETKLSEDINFDLCSYADQYIPDSLLTLIRAVNTVLLILWAAHELMNLTTKLLGGDNTE